VVGYNYSIERLGFDYNELTDTMINLLAVATELISFLVNIFS